MFAKLAAGLPLWFPLLDVAPAPEEEEDLIGAGIAETGRCECDCPPVAALPFGGCAVLITGDAALFTATGVISCALNELFPADAEDGPCCIALAAEPRLLPACQSIAAA